MLLKDDFRVAMDSLKPNVEVMITACDKLLDSSSLKGFLRYVLHAGNFINAVSFYYSYRLSKGVYLWRKY